MSMYATDQLTRGYQFQVPAPALPSGRAPEGYVIQSLEVTDPYAKLDARDYPTMGFGSLLLEDYYQFLPSGMPLNPTNSTGRSPEDRYTQSLLYSRQLESPSTEKAAGLGLSTDLVMSSGDHGFCIDFLNFMARINFAGSERLTAGSLPNSWASQIGSLLGALKPADWRKLKWNDRCCEETGRRPLPAAYAHLLGKIATSRMTDDPLQQIRAYPLQKLNTETDLYLCEDAKIRARIGDNLLPVAPPSFANGPIIDLACDYEGQPESLCAEVVTHTFAKRGGGPSYPLKKIVYPGRVLSIPAKQRLVDIAGVALGRLSSQPA